MSCTRISLFLQLVAAVSCSPMQFYPNIIILVADDLGIGDLGCYGNDTIRTPNIDRLASEGVRLTHHLAAASLCTPSRAALLTARYPARFGLTGAAKSAGDIQHVASRAGLPNSEFTFADAFKAAGNYTTAAVGKWHLGSGCQWWGNNCKGPLNHGFDFYYGIPNTLNNQMKGNPRFWVFPMDQLPHQTLLGVCFIALTSVAAVSCRGYRRGSIVLLATLLLLLTFLWLLITHFRFHTKQWWKLSPWMDLHVNGIVMQNAAVVEQPLVLKGLTQRLLKHSSKLMEKFVKEDRPFLLYHAFGQVHVPMSSAKKFRGASKHGRYGDKVEELDWAVGVLLNKLDRLGIANQTIVYFASDHGGHLEARGADGQREGGYNGLFKGGKGMGAPEGGIRVPGLFRWPEELPAGKVVDVPTSLLDLSPTLLDLARLPSLSRLNPEKRKVDGKSLAELLKGTTTNSPHQVLLHHCRQDIQALRLIKGDHVYKMYLTFPRWKVGSSQCGWGMSTYCGCYGNRVRSLRKQPRLFDLSQDPYEDHPISPETERYKEVTTYLKEYLKKWRRRVRYPASQLSTISNLIWAPWLQPFKFSNKYKPVQS